MQGPDDHGLLRQYLASGDDAAFAQLQRRYVPLVYSAAMRQVRDRHLAEDVTQAVFLVLSQKAARIRQGTPLSAWLHKTTRFAAIDARRARDRRRRAEHRAAQAMQAAATRLSSPKSGASAGPDDWTAVAPVLDEAVSRLRSVDRQAVLLRYFENKSLAEVGAALGISPDAARMRLDRAVLKMRDFFGRRGVHVSATALAPMLITHAIEPAPDHLKLSAASAGGAAAGSAVMLAIARGTSRLLLWNRVRYGAAAVVVAAAVIAGAGAVAPDGNPLALLGLGAPRDPVEAVNNYAAALRRGDAAGMLEMIYTSNPAERRRAEALVRLHLALRRFRDAGERRFGADALANAGFKDSGGGDLSGIGPAFYFQVPHHAPLRIEPEGRVWVPVPEGEVPLVRTGGGWQIDEPTVWGMVSKMLRVSGGTLFSPDIDVLTQSTDHMAQLYESTAAKIESRSLKSAKDAMAVLDDATQGLAHQLPPRPTALLLDVSPAPAPAAPGSAGAAAREPG